MYVNSGSILLYKINNETFIRPFPHGRKDKETNKIKRIKLERS
jgi:hypothetical protein